jgi:hypothetical protein
MLNLDKYQDEIKAIIKDLKADEYTIHLIPDQIVNDGKWMDIIDVVILHKVTGKQDSYMFRGQPKELKQFLHLAVKNFEKQIVKDILDNKPSNSL